MKHAIYYGILKSFFRDTAVLLLITFFYLLFLHMALPRFSKAQYTVKEKRPLTFSFPLNFPSQKQPFVVETHLYIPPFLSKQFRFIPDDCLAHLAINGKTVRLPGRICLGEGEEIDLSDYLVAGDNTLRATIEDTGGRGRLDIRPSVSNNFFIQLSSVMLCIAIFSYGYLRLSLVQDTQSHHRHSSRQ